MTSSRREFLQLAAAMGASLAWGGPARASRIGWTERRDLYPQGVASGDPDSTSVILWTRRPFDGGGAQALTVEVAEDEDFRRVVARAKAPVSAASDWTTRVMVGHLKPARTYFYRFTDSDGNGSRIGRTITAPADDDPRPVNFSFVSCQTINEGKLNGYRRMIFEDERAAPADQLGFVLHLGDFIYEIVMYPDEMKTRGLRTVYEVARFEGDLQVSGFHIPQTLNDYRSVYRGYLSDPDLQDARARWPFVCIWDNHEFSWQGRQSIVQAGGDPMPGQKVRVAANQAWFEFIPARISKPGGPSLDRFEAPAVDNVEIKQWDENGLGTEPNNLAAINSLTVYRALRYGRHLDLFLTDQYSFKGDDPTNVEGLEKIYDPGFGAFSEDAMVALDGGRAAFGGNPPAELAFKDGRVANPRIDGAPRTLMGVKQKAWFLDKLGASTATWKIWGASLGVFDSRLDLENAPDGFFKEKWPAGLFGVQRTDEFGTAYHERGEIFRLVRDKKITGFGIISGDRHSFWAGYAAEFLPPRRYEPVGVNFIGASMSSPGFEGTELGMKKDSPRRAMYLADRPDGTMEWTYNLTVKHGIRSAVEYAKSFDLKKAHALSNPALAPNIEFYDAGGHGYGKVRLSGEEMVTEFVCIPRPITRSERADGGPLRYRVEHRAKLWQAGETPKLEQRVIEGDVGLAI